MTVLDRDTLLRRRPLAIALNQAGFPVAEATLASKATRGGGPPYKLFGRVPLYQWGAAIDWAQARLTPPRSNSSEHRHHA